MADSTIARMHPAVSNVIPASHIRLLSEPLPVGGTEHEPCAEPQVNVIRDGEAVRAIEVVCTCGKRVVLDCVYAAPLAG